MAGRDLAEVLDKMIELVPKTKTEFLDSLRSFRHSASYRAPERMNELWGRVGEHLHDEFGDKPPQWAYPILKVFTGDNWPKVRKALGIEWDES
jgi:hypothetical protein